MANIAAPARQRPPIYAAWTACCRAAASCATPCQWWIPSHRTPTIRYPKRDWAA